MKCEHPGCGGRGFLDEDEDVICMLCGRTIIAAPTPKDRILEAYWAETRNPSFAGHPSVPAPESYAERVYSEPDEPPAEAPAKSLFEMLSRAMKG